MQNCLKNPRALRKIHEKAVSGLSKWMETIKSDGSFDKNIIENRPFFCYIEKNNKAAGRERKNE